MSLRGDPKVLLTVCNTAGENVTQLRGVKPQGPTVPWVLSIIKSVREEQSTPLKEHPRMNQIGVIKQDTTQEASLHLPPSSD